MLQRDYFFEFAGMPKSGKTTIADTVIHFLKREGYKIKDYHGGGRYSPIDKSSLVDLNLYLACKAINFIVTSANSEKVENKIYILDRGIFDRCVFTKALLKMGKIDLEQYTRITNFLGIPFIANKIDAVFLTITTPELSIEREYKNKIVQKQGRVMNTDFLKLLRESSLEEFETRKSIFKNMRLINTEELNNMVVDSSKQIADFIISITED